MISLDSISAPLSDTAPCGPDLMDSGEIYELENMAKPQAARDGDKRIAGDDNMREPDWSKVERFSKELLARTHDLRVAGIYTAARLRNNGLPGLAEGLGLMWQMLEKWGTQAHPVLYPTQRESVLERLSALVSVTVAYKRDGDLLRVVEGVRKTVLASVSTGDFTHGNVLAAHRADGTVNTAALEAMRDAWNKSKDEKKALIQQALENSLVSLAGMEKWIAGNLPDEMLPSNQETHSLYPLIAELQSIQKLITEDSPAADVAENADDGTDASDELPGESSADNAGDNVPQVTVSLDAPAAPGAVVARSGAIRNREDAVRLLGQVRDYFQKTEPTCPANYFIERAMKLAGKNFLEALAELMPESASKFEELAGISKANGTEQEQ